MWRHTWTRDAQNDSPTSSSPLSTCRTPLKTVMLTGKTTKRIVISSWAEVPNPSQSVSSGTSVTMGVA